MGKDCGGNFLYLDNGVKDCSGCMVPHKRENFDYMMGKLMEFHKKMCIRDSSTALWSMEAGIISVKGPWIMAFSAPDSVISLFISAIVDLTFSGSRFSEIHKSFNSILKPYSRITFTAFSENVATYICSFINFLSMSWKTKNVLRQGDESCLNYEKRMKSLVIRPPIIKKGCG